MSDSVTWRGSSETLTEVEYRLEDRTLRVKYRDGTEVTYENVPISAMTEFCQAGSKDSFYYNVLKNQYKTVMNETEYARGQEAIRLLGTLRNHVGIKGYWLNKEIITSHDFDHKFIPAVNAVLDGKK